MITRPECTAAAVTEVLAAAGFTMSEPTGPGIHDRSDGVHAAGLPLAEPRVAVSCQPEMNPVLAAQLTSVIGSAGYQAGRVVELAGEYLVAWAGGES